MIDGLIDEIMIFFVCILSTGGNADGKYLDLCNIIDDRKPLGNFFVMTTKFRVAEVIRGIIANHSFSKKNELEQLDTSLMV